MKEFQREAKCYINKKEKEKKEKTQDSSEQSPKQDNRPVMISDKDFEDLSKLLANNFAQILRSKIQSRVTSSLTIIGNRCATTLTEKYLNKAREGYIKKTTEVFEKLQKKNQLSNEEQKQLEKAEKKLENYSKAHDIEQHRQQRVEDLKKGGPVGIAELQVIANEKNIEISIETPNGEKIQIMPSSQKPTGAVSLKESEKGHLIPSHPIPGFTDNHKDNDCALRAILASENGTMPSSTEVNALRGKVIAGAENSRTVQMNNFIWRNNPGKLRQYGHSTRQAATDALKRKTIFGMISKKLAPISKDQLQACAPEVYQILAEKYPNLSAANYNKLIAAMAHGTQEGDKYFVDLTTGRKHTFNHMLSEDTCKKFFVHLFNEHSQATGNNSNVQHYLVKFFPHFSPLITHLIRGG